MTKPHNPVPYVYLYRQGNFDAIPGSPWVYWITPGLRRVFEELPRLEEVAKPIHGTATYDNFRFLRYWWEVGIERIGFSNRSWNDFEKSDDDFVPYLKGGRYKKWYGNQEFVIHVARRAKALRTFLDSKKDSIRGLNYVFRRGVTYSFLTSGSFSARISPGGFIFDVAGSSLFPEDPSAIYLILGVLNSTFAHYALKLINPTVNFQVGDLARLPVPEKSSNRLRELVEKAIALAKADSEEDETTWDFVAPPDWPDGNNERGTMNDERGTRDDERGTMSDEGGRMKDENGRMGPEERAALLAEIERQIDEEVYRLYGISEEDRQAIEEELGMRNDEGRTRNDER